jgi:hypothetical protein
MLRAKLLDYAMDRGYEDRDRSRKKTSISDLDDAEAL